MVLKHSAFGGEQGPDAAANPENIVREAGIFPGGLDTGPPAGGHRRVTKPWVHVTKVPIERKDHQECASRAAAVINPGEGRSGRHENIFQRR